MVSSPQPSSVTPVQRMPRSLSLLIFRVNVVAHKIELVLAVCRAWMNGQFCRWARKDKPALASVDCLEPEHVAEERAIALGIAAVNDRVQSVDHAFLTRGL